MLDKISFHRHVNFKLTFAFLGHTVFVVCDASIFANNSCPFFELLTFKRSIEAICSHVCLCYSSLRYKSVEKFYKGKNSVGS